jgi:hypothetical protein
MSAGDVHYPPPAPHKPQQWAPALHLQVPVGNPSSFPSPVSPSSALSEPAQYPPWCQPPSSSDGPGGPLALNMSGLSVASASAPSSSSSVHPPTLPSSASTMSPITPISPAQHPFGAPQPIPPQFTFTSGDEPQYDHHGRRLDGRASAGSDKSVPKKRSFTQGGPTLSPMDEYDGPHASSNGSSNGMLDVGPPGSYDDTDMSYSGQSPVDEHSSGEGDDAIKGYDAQPSAQAGIPPGSINIFGKPAGTNNFVTKLYQWVPRGCALMGSDVLRVARCARLE